MQNVLRQLIQGWMGCQNRSIVLLSLEQEIAIIVMDCLIYMIVKRYHISERNVKDIKFRYHWCKKFWYAVAQLVRHTNAELAIERLGQVYGVNQPGGLSGFCKRVGRDKNLTIL